ncbi:MAG: hypothetical protein KIT10_02530 [Flavobacteriales bacterium]|nr:hypothetical protein [Flavobacteriales bacterium]
MQDPGTPPSPLLGIIDPFETNEAWERLGDEDAALVMNEVMRHCPAVGDGSLLLEVERLVDVRPLEGSGYRLVRIPWQQHPGKFLVGFHAPYDLRPLDRLGECFDLVAGLAPLPDTDAARQWWATLKNQWITHASATEPEVPLRLAAISPVTRWRALHSDNDQESREVQALKADLKHPSGNDWQGDELYRISMDQDITCYPAMRLVEVVMPSDNWTKASRAYALIGPFKDGALMEDGIIVRAIDGTSSALHDLNDAEKNGGKSFLQLDGNGARDYVRFFCWAINGEEGSFQIPRDWRELGWQVAPDREVYQLLRATTNELSNITDTKEIERLVPAEQYDHMLSSAVVYGGAAFKACFGLLATGAIAMLEDTPIIGGLKIGSSMIGMEPTRVLMTPDQVADRRHPRSLNHYLLTKHVGKDFRSAQLRVNEQDPKESSERIDQTCVTADQGTFEIKGKTFRTPTEKPLVLNLLELLENGRSLPAAVEFIDCVFEAPLHLAHWSKDDHKVALRFLRCEFQNGLKASNMLINGSLDLIACEIGKGRSSTIALELDNTVVNGSLTIWETLMTGRCHAPGIRVDGSLSLRGVRIANINRGAMVRWLRFRDLDQVEINKHHVKKDERQVKEYDMAGFKAEPFESSRALCLDGAQVQGILSITLAMDESEEIYRPFDKTRSSYPIRSSVSIVCGGLSAKAMSIKGETVLYGTISLGDWDMSGSTFGGDVTYYYWDAHVGRNFRVFDGDLNMSSGAIQGDLDLRTMEVAGDVLLYGMRVAGNIGFLGLSAKDLHLQRTSIGMRLTACMWDTQATMLSTHLKGGVYLNGADIGELIFQGVHIDGPLWMRAGCIGRVMIRPGLHRASVVAEAENASPAPVFKVEPTRLGGFYMASVLIKESMICPELILELPADEKLRQTVRDVQERSAFQLRQSKVGGDLQFFQSDVPARLRRDMSDLPGNVVYDSDQPLHTTAASEARFWGGIDLRGSEIGGDLDLRHIHVDGDLRLNDLHVRLDLVASGQYERPEREGSFSTGSVRFHGLLTKAHSMHLEKLQCGGDLDLSGLELTEDLAGRGMKVRGTCALVDKDGHKEVSTGRSQKNAKTEVILSGTYRPYARIIGKADLASLEANHFLVCGHVFPALTRHSDHRAAASGTTSVDLDLERSRLGELEILTPTPDNIRLSNIQVDRWRIGTSDTPTASGFIGVLRKMVPFDRAVWLDVEKYFRNRNQNWDANRIYRSMVRASLENHPQWELGLGFWLRLVGFVVILALLAWSYPSVIRVMLERGLLEDLLHLGMLMAGVWLVLSLWSHRTRLLLNELYAIPTAHGTQPWRPMIGTVISFVLVMSILTDGNKVAATLSHMEVVGKDEKEGMEYTPYELVHEWTWQDAMGLSIRYVIPLAPLVTHERWEAGRTAAFEGSRVTAEQVAMWVQLYNWIAWPLFLIFMAARAFRGKQT